jgi:hypothetical protein
MAKYGLYIMGIGYAVHRRYPPVGVRRRRAANGLGFAR